MLWIDDTTYSSIECKLLLKRQRLVVMPKATKSHATGQKSAPLVAAKPETIIDSGHEEVHVPKFAPHSSRDDEEEKKKVEFRRVSVPQHRMTPLKNNWLSLYKPITENLKLDMRMNLKSRKVEIKTTEKTPDAGNLQRAADFVHAFILGFEVNDAIALLRLDDLYIESFEVKDVKTLRGEHLARGIGRMAGKSGKTKFTIENASRTRIVIADTKIHILGSFQNIRVARDAICNLIMGSPAGKVYNRLRSVSARLNSSY